MNKLTTEDKKKLLDDVDAHIVYELNKGGLNITGDDGYSLEECKLIVNKYTDEELKMAISVSAKIGYIQAYLTALKEEKQNRDFEKALGLRK